jgi:hypothetical protein
MLISCITSVFGDKPPNTKPQSLVAEIRIKPAGIEPAGSAVI